MNAISGILSREFITKDSPISILWTSTDNMIFDRTIKKLNHKFIGLDNLYFGADCPNMIICNNKILFYEQCKNISIQFHIPVLLIDHVAKPKELNDDEGGASSKYELPSVYKVAMNEDVASSWKTNYNKILTSKQDISDTELWHKIIFQTCKMVLKYYV